VHGHLLAGVAPDVVIIPAVIAPTDAEQLRRTALEVWEAIGRGTVSPDRREPMATLLWILAVALVIWGIVTLVRGGVLMGIVLIVIGLLVGPGGVSIFT
jgi:hypothetical protein